MPKLFVFGIGGTGARVIKSLTMLLATGVKAGDFDVVPILVDPHESLKEQNDCKKLLHLYAEIHALGYRDLQDVKEDCFFRTKISTLASVARGTGIKDGFGMEGNFGKTFGQFLDRHNLPDKTKQFLSLLYSDKDNFNKNLSMGFKGNPNVGSIVLNSLNGTQLFKAFETAFGEGDRVFIISSIFGGTGAAGFPLLLKNLRQHTDSKIRQAPIGALTVMPYFKLGDPGSGKDATSDIDSRNFLTKTKSALSYYIGNITNCSALYYIGDPYEQTKAYQNDEATQPDDAHLVEMLGALAPIHFVSQTFSNGPQQVFEYGLKEDQKEIHFRNIGDSTTQIIAAPLTSLYIFNRLHKEIKTKPNLPFRITSKFNDMYFHDPFFSKLEEFLDEHFEIWINQLAGNERGFKPFNTTPGRKDYLQTVKDYEQNKKFLTGIIFKPFDNSDMFVKMAKRERTVRRLSVNPKYKYLSMAYRAINASIKENIIFQSV